MSPRKPANAFTMRADTSRFLDDPAFRTKLYSKWRQTAQTVPWPQYREAHTDTPKRSRRHSERAVKLRGAHKAETAPKMMRPKERAVQAYSKAKRGRVGA